MIVLYNNRKGLTSDVLDQYFNSVGIDTSIINIDDDSVTSIIADHYLICGYDAYHKVTELVHMGFRKNPDWEHVKRLEVIRLSCGAELIITDGTVNGTLLQIDKYLRGDRKPAPAPLKTNMILKTKEEIVTQLTLSINSYEVGELVGFDYETTGLYDSDEKSNADFRATGVSISIRDFSFFIDFRSLSDDDKEEVRELLSSFCRKFQSNIYAFNSGFEYMTTVFECGEAFEFNDLRHYWVQDGYHQDFESFKYIARYYLHVPDWDGAFDMMSDVFGEFYMMIDQVPDGWEKFQHWCTKSPYQNKVLTLDDIGCKSGDLCKLKKDDKLISDVITNLNTVLAQFNEQDWIEFSYLINSPMWNVSVFGIIPSRFLGYYCNLDAYYTKECVVVNQGKYTDLCTDVYKDNSKFGMTINATGVYKDREAYDEYWKVLNQKLAHQAWVLGIHGLRRRLDKLNGEEPRISDRFIKGLPTYMTLMPTEILTNSALPKKYKYPSAISAYTQVPINSLIYYTKIDKFYEICNWLTSYDNPYLIVQSLLNRLNDWEITTGKTCTIDDPRERPLWVNDEYEYWGIVRQLKSYLKPNKVEVISAIRSGDWDKVNELEGAGIRKWIEKLAHDLIEMILDYNFRKIVDANREWYELKKVVESPKYYNERAEASEPQLVPVLNVPDSVPGFIHDVLKKGFSLNDLYYYVKDLILELYNPLYERNYDENKSMMLFNNYTPIDQNYQTLKDEIDDWLFWKQDVIDEGLVRKLSVVRGIAKVLKRVIDEKLGDISNEEFLLLGEITSIKTQLDELIEIPEFKSFTSHEDLPDLITYKGDKISTHDFQNHVLRNILKLTAPVDYDAYMDDYLIKYSKEVKFSVIVHQYSDLYNKYMRKTELDTSKSWVDQFLQEYNEFDLSKLYVIDDKDLSQTNELTKIKIIIAHDFKNKVVAATKIDTNNDNDIYHHADILSEYIPRFQFMETTKGGELQVIVYEAKQLDGKFKVSKQDYLENPTPELRQVMIQDYTDLISKCNSLYINVVGLDVLPTDVITDFMSPLGTVITQLSESIKDLYESKLGIKINNHDDLVQTCLDMLTDVDKSWMVNERQYMTDWLIRHMYHVSYLSDHYGDEWTDKFIEYVDSNDVDPNHPLYAYKIFFMQRMFKKDNKALSYLTGMLRDYDTYYDEIDEFTMLGTRWSTEPKSAKWCKMMVPWGCNVLASKRWNGPLQTLTKGAEYRRVCGTPTNKFLTYYDISQAEPRTSAYTSGDENMIYYFENNIDLYIACGELFIGRKALDWEERLYLRNLFKSILLGIIYKMGPVTLAANTGLTVENAKRGIEIMEGKFPRLTAWCTSNSEYCISNNGEIKTILGDKLWSDADPSRFNSIGANQPVQNYSSVVLVHGFYNVIRAAIEHEYSIRPELVVHDASINISDIRLFPVIFPFYKKYFQDFLKSKSGIVFKYDLEVMANYYDVCFIKNIVVDGEPDRYELKGTNKALNLMLQKFKDNDMGIEILEQKTDFEEVYHHRYKDSLHNQGDTAIHKDHSDNKIVFKFTQSTDEILALRTLPNKIK